MEERKCLNCQEALDGRADKKFCTRYCRSYFHNQLAKSKVDRRFKEVDDQLKLNRRILKKHNRSGKSIVRQEELFAEGFNPRIFTGYWKNQQGNTYLFCYEFGFMSTKQKERSKYVLIMWQSYMN
jgi:hypothetical protein